MLRTTELGLTTLLLVATAGLTGCSGDFPWIKSSPFGPSNSHSSSTTISLKDFVKTFEPDDRELIEKLPAEDAWYELKRPPTLSEKILFSRRPNADQLAAIEQNARSEMQSQVPVEAFRSLVAELTRLVDAQLRDICANPPKGTKYAIVVGKFSNHVKNADVLDDALASVADDLIRNSNFKDQLVFCQFGESDYSDVLAKIGGGSTEWVNQKGTNLKDVRVASYHPDDIYVLTGSMKEHVDQTKHNVAFDVTARLEHPRTQSIAGVATASSTVECKYVFHPISGWLSEAENTPEARLKAVTDRKAADAARAQRKKAAESASR